MSWKDFLMPTSKKIAVSVTITLLWIVLQFALSPIVSCLCKPGGFQNCTDYYQFLIIKKSVCHCNCIQLSQVLNEYLYLIVIPFVVVYLICSFIQFRK